jgi:apolipoprotein D and lipocalin family protein
MTIRALALALVAALTGCSNHPPMKSVEYVDIDRYMGDWYVIANIPTFVETGAHNAIESYALNADGSIATTFSFNDESFEGERKKYQPTGFIIDRHSNAVWGMQFIWPFKADYRIVYLNEDYSVTVIAREARDYVWIMSRSPVIEDAEYTRLVDLIAALGYKRAEIQRVPQSWPDPNGEQT